jgi:uncharacterized protein YjbI with pentapeptide repeats
LVGLLKEIWNLAPSSFYSFQPSELIEFAELTGIYSFAANEYLNHDNALNALLEMSKRNKNNPEPEESYFEEAGKCIVQHWATSQQPFSERFLKFLVSYFKKAGQLERVRIFEFINKLYCQRNDGYQNGNRRSRELLNKQIEMLRFDPAVFFSLYSENAAKLYRGLGGDFSFQNQKIPKGNKIAFLSLNHYRLGLDLTGVDFNGAVLAEGNFCEQAILSQTNLNGVNLSHKSLNSSNLKDASLCFSNLEQTSFEGADLQEADLRYANLNGAYFKGAKLNGAKFSLDGLVGVNLTGTDLRGVRWYGERETILYLANDPNGRFLPLSQYVKEISRPFPKGCTPAVWDNHFLYMSSVNQIQRYELRTSTVCLNDSILDEAILEGMNLNNAYLNSVTLKSANCKGTKFKGANLTEVNFKDANLVGANFSDAEMEGARFEGANISGADFTGLNDITVLEGAIFDKNNPPKIPDGFVWSTIPIISTPAIGDYLRDLLVIKTIKDATSEDILDLDLSD